MNLLIGLGDTVDYKMGAWSGTNRSVPPNQLLHWAGMSWARDRGYRYYDFDDISAPAAHVVRCGGELPAGTSTLTRFKLRFGGDVVLFPGTSERFRPAVPSPAMRLMLACAGRLRPAADRLLRRSA